MSLRITEDTMAAVVNGEAIVTGTRSECGWHVTTWPRPLDRNAAITALMLAERLITHGEDDPCAREWLRELGRA
ncbi:hypothetical protein BKA00_003164 [Actinomadura coerulea]|uniref:Uncharacterized protein n=1 Tax=Actinomadura coerulea TaxID=46159 RepID=A0A7X0G039_9ACTN|nr:hypothetical protein [Actinomadura coerulea]MBB6396250.1 hypothetical protein [Actinomadura coerulea]GGQ39101.1 hypothetical protein GCM10010187_66350 [Actinomadura coerulea]